MLRRVTKTLLAISYFAAQMAAVPHVHAGDRANLPADHDARPHLHLSESGHWTHAHPQTHDDHCLHHDIDSDHSHPAQAIAAEEHDDHESDAVYLPSDISDSLLTKAVAVPGWMDIVSDLPDNTATTFVESFHSSLEAQIPDKCESGRTLYLALRALRI